MILHLRTVMVHSKTLRHLDVSSLLSFIQKTKKRKRERNKTKVIKMCFLIGLNSVKPASAHSCIST